MSLSDESSGNAANILLLMSGSIACAKASHLVSAWVKQGHAVQVACTSSASAFVGPATLEGLSGRPVLVDLLAPGQVMDHIHLARWADIVVAAPATSNLINKLCAGIADDAVTCLWQAAFSSDRPMIIVPAMNTRMWNYPATRKSVQQLQSWGIKVLPAAVGDLACGEVGDGRMLEPMEVLQHIEPYLRTTGTIAGPGAGKRVLLTAGGTREAIDSVRYIGNFSTGRTAAVLAERLSNRGYEVTWLGAESAIRPLQVQSTEVFVSFDQLREKLAQLLGRQSFDAVIHAAAVSDFFVDRLEIDGVESAAGRAKVSSNRELKLYLKPNPKLLRQIRGWSCNPATRVIAFKLTHGADQKQARQAVADLLEGAGVYAVVHNDLDDMRNGQHPFTVYTSPADRLRCADSVELASSIEQLLEHDS